MKVVLTQWIETQTCCWCEKERECTKVTFSDGFLKDSAICWKCLQTAFKVRSKQTSASGQDETTK